MEYLVAYDIETLTPAGERRLRAVAKVCEGYGQRVQKSVFECTIAAPTRVRMIHDLREAMDSDTDRISIYRLREPYVRHVVRLGGEGDIDWRRPWVL